MCIFIYNYHLLQDTLIDADIMNYDGTHYLSLWTIAND